MYLFRITDFSNVTFFVQANSYKECLRKINKKTLQRIEIFAKFYVEK